MKCHWYFVFGVRVLGLGRTFFVLDFWEFAFCHWWFVPRSLNEQISTSLSCLLRQELCKDLLSCHFFNPEREISSLEYSISHSTQTTCYTHARRNRLLFAMRQRGITNTVFLDPFRKDLARMNGMPQPNQKWLPEQEIKPGSLNHKLQPSTIGPFLTTKIYFYCAFTFISFMIYTKLGKILKLSKNAHEGCWRCWKVMQDGFAQACHCWVVIQLMRLICWSGICSSLLIWAHESRVVIIPGCNSC